MGPTSTSSAGLFMPPGQSEVAGEMGDLIKSLADISKNGGQGTPGGWAYPQSQSLYPTSYNAAGQFLTGSLGGGEQTLWDQLSGQAIGSAQNAYENYLPQYQSLMSSIPGLTQGANTALSYLPQAASNAFSPMYDTMVNAAADNPQYAQALTGAAQSAAYGAQGAKNMQNSANQIYLAGFDPRSALYQRGQQGALDRSNAINAMSGLASSPYGAGVTAKSLSDYGIDWENQQLNRMQDAGKSSSSLYGGASDLAYSSAQRPNQVYMKQIQDVLSALKARTDAGSTGASTIESLLGSGGKGLTQASDLSTSLAKALSSIGGNPYSTGATIGSNALSAQQQLQNQLKGSVDIGNQQYNLPQTVIEDMLKYLGVGQQASVNNAAITNTGFNQTASGIGGALSGLNTLFGKSGIMPLASMGSMAASSDRRLKRDIRRIGTLLNGLPVYVFRYLWGEARHVGLMADEVERVRPEAVLTGPFGYKMVNYALAMR